MDREKRLWELCGFSRTGRESSSLLDVEEGGQDEPGESERAVANWFGKSGKALAVVITGEASFTR